MASPHVMPGTLAKIAAGRKNMFATTWSKPIATKAMIGKKMPRILPPVSSADIATHTARQTSQLQPMARRKICQSVSVPPLSSAIAARRSKVIAGGVPASAPAEPITPALMARK